MEAESLFEMGTYLIFYLNTSEVFSNPNYSKNCELVSLKCQPPPRSHPPWGQARRTGGWSEEAADTSDYELVKSVLMNLKYNSKLTKQIVLISKLNLIWYTGF